MNARIIIVFSDCIYYFFLQIFADWFGVVDHTGDSMFIVQTPRSEASCECETYMDEMDLTAAESSAVIMSVKSVEAGFWI